MERHESDAMAKRHAAVDRATGRAVALLGALSHVAEWGGAGKVSEKQRQKVSSGVCLWHVETVSLAPSPSRLVVTSGGIRPEFD
jgi:hypothetical protein